MAVVVAVVGGTNSGKTTLIEKLIPELRHRGYRVGTVKHVKHDVVYDQSGKDSWRHAQAGAQTVIVDADESIVMFKSLPASPVSADRLTANVLKYFDDVDIVLAEGYKNTALPKIEVYRKNVNKGPVALGDQSLLAIVTDAQIEADVPRYGLEDIDAISDLIVGIADQPQHKGPLKE